MVGLVDYAFTEPWPDGRILLPGKRCALTAHLQFVLENLGDV